MGYYQTESQCYIIEVCTWEPKNSIFEAAVFCYPPSKQEPSPAWTFDKLFTAAGVCKPYCLTLRAHSILRKPSLTIFRYVLNKKLWHCKMSDL